MKISKITGIIFFFAFAKILVAQQDLTSIEISGQELLSRAIAYHDPEGNWATFQGEFTVVLESPKIEDRKSTITIDLPNEFFNLSEEKGVRVSFKEITGNTCRFTTENGEIIMADSQSEACNRSVMMKNYYTYLYGLPMKLRDPGTIIDPTVSKQRFNGKEYLVLRVSYDKNVGSDIWQFYFNPASYAMEIYQFFKGQDQSTGEYILLSGETVINDIKMPQSRAWFYNKDDGYLGTDKIAEN